MQRYSEFQKVRKHAGETENRLGRWRSHCLAGTALAGIVGGFALLAGAQPAAAACTVVSSGVSVTTGGTTDCVTTAGGVTDDLNVILQGTAVPFAGIDLDDINVTGPAEDSIEIQVDITDNFGAVGPVINSGGHGINVISDGATTADGIGGFYFRDAGSISISTQTGGNVTGSESAINAVGANVTITNDGATLTGELTTVDAVIGISATGLVTIENNGGTITNLGNDADEIAIQVTNGGFIDIYNDGTIIGQLDLSGGTSSIVENNSNTTWTTTGTNNFTLGADTLTNTSVGLIEALDTTDFNFYNGIVGDDEVVNAGEIQLIINLDANAFANFTDLETFTNSGLLNMHDGNTAAGDGITMGLAAYNAMGGALLSVDSRLGGLSSTNVCGLLSDCLQIGSSTGTTDVLVTDTTTQDNASYNPDGILVVDGSSALSGFILDAASDYYAASHVFEQTTGLFRSVLDKGLFFYDLLYYTPAQQHRLYGVPDAEAFEISKLETIAQNIWYSTSPWHDRQADLRDNLAAGGDVTPGLWFKALGARAERETYETFDIIGYSYGYQINYDQDTYGAMMGGDIGTKGVFGESDAILAGISAGYVDSEVDFNSPTSASFDGLVGGVYLTYLSGGFYLDISGKANVLTMDYSAPTLGGYEADPNVTTYGGQIDMGHRFGKNFFIEPIVSATYAHTEIDDFTVLGTTVDFDDADTLRVSAGLRLGGMGKVSEGTLVAVSLTGRVWEEIEGENDVTFHSEGPDLTLEDDFSGTFGEVGANISVNDMGSGWSAFIAGGSKFKTDYTDTSARIGVRLQF